MIKVDCRDKNPGLLQCTDLHSATNPPPFVRIPLDNGGRRTGADKEVNFSFLFSAVRPLVRSLFSLACHEQFSSSHTLLAKTSIYVKQPKTCWFLSFSSLRYRAFALVRRHPCLYEKDNFEMADGPFLNWLSSKDPTCVK